MKHEYRLFGNKTSVIVRALVLHIRTGNKITLILLASTPPSFGSEASQLILGVVENYARPQTKWDSCFEEDHFTCYPIQNATCKDSQLTKRGTLHQKDSMIRTFSASCFLYSKYMHNFFYANITPVLLSDAITIRSFLQVWQSQDNIILVTN